MLHLTGDMGNHLNVAAEVAAAAFLVEDAPVDLAACGEIVACKVLVENSLVGPQIHVGFHPVVENENLAVTKRIERARIDVQVAFQLDRGDGQTLVLKQLRHRGRKDPLAEAAHDGPHHHHVFVAAALVAFGDG